MVRKLIKNEFLDSVKNFKPVLLLIAGIVGIVVLLKFTAPSLSDNAFFPALLVFLIYAFVIAIVVLTILSFIQLLYKSLYKRESYRLFTLPVGVEEILISKVVVSFIWTAIISLASFLAVTFIILFILGDIPEFTSTITDLFAYVYSQLPWTYLTVQLVNNFVGIAYAAVLFLFVGSIVNSSYIQNRRTLWFVVIYFAIYYILGRIWVMFDTQSLSFVFDESYISQWVYGNTVNFDWSLLFKITVDQAGLQAQMLAMLLRVILTGFFGFGTVWFWNKKLEMID